MMDAMKITNKEDILKNAVYDENRKARTIALKVLGAALNAVDPRRAVKNHIRRVNNTFIIDKLTFNLNKFQRVFVVGCGKASGAMAEALEEVMENRITKGFVNTLRGTKSSFKTHKIFLNEADHPVPNEDGVRGARKIVELVNEAGEDDLVFCLISGGGSALMPLPAADITLSDKQKLAEDLLKCGASINEINVVRKHISEIKGGQLARIAYPATIISLILSDVVGDPLDIIASGPTVPDKTTFNDAINVLKKYNLWEIAVPKSIRKRLEAGSRGKILETPKPGDKVFEKTHNIIVGNNRLAALVACQEAKKLGFNTFLLSTMIEGEARHVGTTYAGIMKKISASDNPIKKPGIVIAGGETTVTVTGQGRGGRNQELVLSASLKIGGLRGVCIASIGTDGVDGPTDAAGAIADGQTLMRAHDLKLDPKVFLRNNDSYSFFSKLNDLTFTGPTGTNVNDIVVMVVI